MALYLDHIYVAHYIKNLLLMFLKFIIILSKGKAISKCNNWVGLLMSFWHALIIEKSFKTTLRLFIYSGKVIHIY